jgi:hypothetical protein
MSENSNLFVTAFKDIGRNNWNAYYRRNIDEYFNNFGRLLKCGFKLICFCDYEIGEILKNKYNFNSIYSYDSDNTFFKYLNKQREIINSDYFNNLIKHRKLYPECSIPEYNIVNHNKVIFLKRAKQLFPNYTHYTWIDFGFMSEDQYIISNFNWNLLNNNKIQYSKLCNKNIKYIDPITNCKEASELISGGSFIVPNQLIEWYCDEYEKMILYFQELNIVDDDQAICLQIYFKNIHLFFLSDTGWFDIHKMYKKN